MEIIGYSFTLFYFNPNFSFDHPNSNQFPFNEYQSDSNGTGDFIKLADISYYYRNYIYFWNTGSPSANLSEIKVVFNY